MPTRVTHFLHFECTPKPISFSQLQRSSEERTRIERTRRFLAPNLIMMLTKHDVAGLFASVVSNHFEKIELCLLSIMRRAFLYVVSRYNNHYIVMWDTIIYMMIYEMVYFYIHSRGQTPLENFTAFTSDVEWTISNLMLTCVFPSRHM